MRRLRQKLEQFYASEGAQEPLQIVIPMGSCTPFVQLGNDGIPAAAADAVESQAVQELIPAVGATRQSRWWWTALAVAVLGVGPAVLLGGKLRHRELPFPKGSWRTEPLTLGRELEFDPATTRDGKRLTYVSRTKDSFNRITSSASWGRSGRGIHRLALTPGAQPEMVAALAEVNPPATVTATNTPAVRFTRRWRTTRQPGPWCVRGSDRQCWDSALGDTLTYAAGAFVAPTTAVGTAAAQTPVYFTIGTAGTLHALSNSNVLTPALPGWTIRWARAAPARVR